MFDYKHNHITQAPNDCVSEVHCSSSVLPVNMKGVTAIDVMLCLTTPHNNYLLIRGLIFHHRFPCTALQFTHCGDIDVEG